MSFRSPERLWLLIAVALALGAYVLSRRRRPRDAVMFSNVALLREFVSRYAWRRHLTAAGFLLFAAVLVVAIAEPQHEAKAAVRERDLVVVLAIDASRSMGATDVTPSRLVAAQRGAAAFVRSLPHNARVGLLLFGAEVEFASLPTLEHGKVLDALKRVSLRDGTAIADAVITAIAAIEDTGNLTGNDENQPHRAAVVLISDGEPTAGSSMDDAISAAKKAAIPVSTVALGTLAGEVDYLGKTASVPVEKEVLRNLAESTPGQFREADGSTALKVAYNSVASAFEAPKAQRSLASWFLGGALVIGMLVACASLRWFWRVP